jgi:hypothetical protein
VKLIKEQEAAKKALEEAPPVVKETLFLFKIQRRLVP